MVGLRMFQRSIGFISTLVLARLLVPADFGLVAMATVLMQFLIAVSDFSVHVLLIQKTSIDREDMDSAWSMQAALGLAQAVILLGLANPAADFYNEPRLVEIVYTLAAIALLKGFKNIGVIMFQRDMTFGLDFRLMAIQRLLTFTVTISIAWIYQTYWALVVGMMVGAVAELALSYGMHPFRPRFSTKRWGEIFKFSKWLVANNILSFLGQRGPDLVLGRLIGPRAVGLFSISYEIAMLPSTELVAPINRAALPGYSRLREQEGGLQRGYFDVLGLIALVAVPASVGIAASAEVLIPFLLGEKWHAAIPIVHHLALAGAITVLMTNNGAVYLALGKPRITTFLLAARLVLLLPGIVVGANYAGVEGVALSYLVVILLMLGANLVVLLRVLGLSFQDYLRVVYRPLFAAAAMYASLSMFVLPWTTTQYWSPPAASLLVIVSGLVLYVVGVAFLWALAGRQAGPESRVMDYTFERLRWGRAQPVTTSQDRQP